MKRWFPLIPLLLAILVYAPAPWGELVWDDQIVLDKQMIAFDSIRDAFFPPDEIFQWSKNYYRPVVVLSYMLDLGLYGEARTAGLHISNVLYHVITTFFVWLLAWRLLLHLPNGAFGAMVAATVFAVHPIHTESVSWITGRSDVLATMFFVPGVLATLFWRDSGAIWALALGAFLYLLALLSKEVAIAALIIVPLVLLLARPREIGSEPMAHEDAVTEQSFTFAFRSNIAMWLTAAFVYIGVTGLYLALRQTGGIVYGVSLNVTWLEYLVRFERSIAYYLVKVLVPWPQSSHVAWDLTPGDIVTNVVFLVAIGLLWLSVSIFKRYRDGSVLLAMAWFGGALAPSVLVAVRHISGVPLAERYLYLPSVGVALLLGIFCCQPYFRRWVKPAAGATAVLVVAYAVATVERGVVWSSNLNLWTDTTKKAPSHGEPWNLLGIAYQESGDDAKALDAYRRAIDGINSSTGKSYAKRNIALIYHSQNNLPRAKEYFISALEDEPDNSEVHHGLGVIFIADAKNARDRGSPLDQVFSDLEKARKHFSSAARLNPFHSEARWGLVSALTQQGEIYEFGKDKRRAAESYRSAVAEIERLIARDPAYGSRIDIMERRAALNTAIKRLAG